MIPYPKQKWYDVRKSYFDDGVTSPTQLAMLHNVTVRAIQARMYREGWRKKLEARFERKIVEAKAGFKRDGKPLQEMINEHKGTTARQMIESASGLLDKVHQRIKVLTPRDGGEITEMIGALKNLQAMLDNLLGGGKAGGSVTDTSKVQVNILAQVVEAADRVMSEGGEGIKVSCEEGEVAVDDKAVRDRVSGQDA